MTFFFYFDAFPWLKIYFSSLMVRRVVLVLGWMFLLGATLGRSANLSTFAAAWMICLVSVLNFPGLTWFTLRRIKRSRRGCWDLMSGCLAQSLDLMAESEHHQVCCSSCCSISLFPPEETVCSKQVSFSLSNLTYQLQKYLNT